ncbi:MAG: hypothetical protein LC624_11700 [Halobacteriales archaeon]|nr:hypothetical protein [Halobacteriales archaeon]
MHFVLLALEGRITAQDATREDVRRALAEYHGMVSEYRAMLDPQPAGAPPVHARALYGDEAPRA